MLSGWFDMLRWARKVRSADKGRDGYAAHSDFCAVFLQQLDRLYLLALILTGDELRAEECLLAALDSCEQRDLVFKESALSWSRRAVIKTAIRSMSPAPFDPARHYLLGHRGDPSFDQDVSIKCLLELRAFDRFVFVMSVLESYSDRDCALLLGCSCADVVVARIRASQQISRRLTAMYPDDDSGSQPYVVDADWLECG
jgi:DNA-directed RNA polymerase specialized sigma24 family protein